MFLSLNQVSIPRTNLGALTGEVTGLCLHECTSFYFVWLHFTLHVLDLFFFFLNKLKVCGNSVLSKSINTIFLTFAHIMSLYHILVILTVFQTLSNYDCICYGGP